MQGNSRSNQTQEQQELLIAMTWHATGDDGSFRYIQRSEQRRGSMPFVVVRYRCATSFLHRQAGLGSIQRLDLTLLVHTNDQCLIRGIQIQAHHVSQFLHELGIARQLKLAHSTGLQPVSIPDALKRRCTRTAVAPFGLLCNVATLSGGIEGFLPRPFSISGSGLLSKPLVSDF